jgi:DUF1680 family protein
LEIDGEVFEIDDSDGYARVRRDWRGGEHLALTLPVAAQLSVADPRVDAVRGCAAVERGPLVYCFEQIDQDVALDEVSLLGPVKDAEDVQIGDLRVPAVVLEAEMLALPGREGAIPGWGYRPAAVRPGTGAGVGLTAVPYFAWANRGYGAMRVWLPTARASEG